MKADKKYQLSQNGKEDKNLTDKELIQYLISKINQKIIAQDSSSIDIENSDGIEPISFHFNSKGELTKIIGY